jgi:hypothetical protein
VQHRIDARTEQDGSGGKGRHVHLVPRILGDLYGVHLLGQYLCLSN